jgi:hypothetical protein
VSGQLQSPAALPPGKEHRVSVCTVACFKLMPWNSEWKSEGCWFDYSTLNLLKNKVAWNLTKDILEFSYFVVCRAGSRRFRIDNMLYGIKRR